MHQGEQPGEIAGTRADQIEVEPGVAFEAQGER